MRTPSTVRRWRMGTVNKTKDDGINYSKSDYFLSFCRQIVNIILNFISLMPQQHRFRNDFEMCRIRIRLFPQPRFVILCVGGKEIITLELCSQTHHFSRLPSLFQLISSNKKRQSFTSLTWIYRSKSPVYFIRWMTDVLSFLCVQFWIIHIQ